jgi:hypothetical protein
MERTVYAALHPFARRAPFLGMDKNRFNREVRPRLTEIRIGIQGRLRSP